MVRTYGLQTATDLLAKLERDLERLNEEVTGDGFFNFVVTGYSLIDWVRNDPSVPENAKGDVDEFRRRDAIRVCRDLANASKHFELTPDSSSRAVNESAHSECGFGVGRYEKGGFGRGEESIQVVQFDGSMRDGIELAEDVVKEWKAFFSAHQINGTPDD